MGDQQPRSMDEYLANCPADARTSLAALRRAVRATAPEAVESISYGIPTFKYLGRPLIYFGAWKNHCALYGVDLDAHRGELEGYETVKGTVRFPHGTVVPEGLIASMVRGRIEVIEAAAAARRAKRKRA